MSRLCEFECSCGWKDDIFTSKNIMYCPRCKCPVQKKFSSFSININNGANLIKKHRAEAIEAAKNDTSSPTEKVLRDAEEKGTF